MKGARLLSAMTLLGVLLVSTGVARDWPQWRGADRDGKAVDFKAPASWPEQLQQAWRTTVGSGDSTPALVGDRLYVFTRQGDEETTLCLNAATGEIVWTDKYAAKAVTGAAGRHPGPRSSPAVAEGKVVTLGVGGVVSCLDAADGKMVWRKDPFEGAVPRFFTSMSPIVVDGMAIVHAGTAGKGAILAYNLADGAEKWRWDGEGPEYASPALLTVGGVKQIVTLAEKSIVGVAAADGKLLWRLPFAPSGRAYNTATPIVDGDTVIYTGAGRGTFAVKIEKQGEAFAATPLWSNTDIATQYNTPVLKDGMLYGMSDRGNLFCISAKDGKTAWVDETSRDRSGFGTVVDAGSVLLALPSSGEMLVYKPTADGYSQTAAVKVGAASTYGYPVATDNRIFVKDENTVALYVVE